MVAAARLKVAATSLCFHSKGDIVDPSMQGLVSQLCLPDPVKRLLAGILRFTVSLGPDQGRDLEEEGPREPKGSERGGGLSLGVGWGQRMK